MTLPQATPATLRRRLICMVYETILVLAIVFLAALLFPGAASGRLSGAARHTLFIYLVLVMGIYFTWCWARGQTLAMRAWRLRVVDLNGMLVSWQRAAARYLAALALVGPALAAMLWLREQPHSALAWALVAIGVVSIAWALGSSARRAAYDVIAGTQLVVLPRTL